MLASVPLGGPKSALVQAHLCQHGSGGWDHNDDKRQACNGLHENEVGLGFGDRERRVRFGTIKRAMPQLKVREYGKG